MRLHENILTDRKKTLSVLFVFTAVFVLFLLAGPGSGEAKADRLYPSFYSTDGSACSNISDADYFTTEYFDPGTEVTLSSDTPIDSLYIVWENYPGPWELTVNGRDYTFGTEGYLHEYVKLPEEAKGADSVTLTVGDSRITIADIYAFSAGGLPGFVQTWEPSYDKADVLLISTHADDEVLFFGGIIPNYVDRGGVRIQLAYFSDLFQSEPYRNHEILNGLWTMGITHYPQLGKFYDNYSESFEEAETQFNYNEGLEYIVETIRRFKPQVVIGQDIINGEYGHGGHMWCAKLIADALEVTADEQSFAESAGKYGTWDVPKTYFHLYPENPIELDARAPLAAFGGKTELEVAKEAYLEHKSQQWTWFYVSDGYDDEGNPDGYEYSCTKYGLYRTLVGDDFSGNDILDNIVPYDEQIAIAEQEAREKALKEEQERKAQAAQDLAQGETTPAESIVNESNRTAMPGGKNTTAITVLIVLAVIIIVIIVGILVLSRIRQKEAARKRRARARQNAYMRQVSNGGRAQGQAGAQGERTAASQGTYRMLNGKNSASQGTSRTQSTRANTAQRTAGSSRTANAARRSTGGPGTANAAQRSTGSGQRTSGSTPERRVSRSSNGTYSSDRSRRQ